MKILIAELQGWNLLQMKACLSTINTGVNLDLITYLVTHLTD